LLLETVPSAQGIPEAAGVSLALALGVFAFLALDLVEVVLVVPEVDLGLVELDEAALAAPVQVATPPCPRQAPLLVLALVVVPSLQVPVAAAWAARLPATGRPTSRPKARPTVAVERRRRMRSPD
jgi:hypothetical protein